MYTIGRIGGHMVVSTKLAQTGWHKEAQISTGNTTTRLLGECGWGAVDILFFLVVTFSNLLFFSNSIHLKTFFFYLRIK